MTKWKVLSVGALLIAVFGTQAHEAGQTAAPQGPGAAVSSTFSIGEFAVQVARSLQLQAPSEAGFTPQSAAWALWRSGVRLRPELEEPVTEQDVVLTMQQLGFNLIASEPSRLVLADKAGKILSTFINSNTGAALRRRDARASGAQGGNDDFNNGKGIGGKFKRKGGESPSSDAP